MRPAAPLAPFAPLARLVALAGCAALTTLAACEGGRPPAVDGTPAPAYAARTLDDAPVTLAAQRGAVVVLNRWATWCGPCREEIPQLEALHRRVAGQGVRVIGVSIDAAGSGLDVRDFMQEHGVTYTVWLDPSDQFAPTFGSVGVPETFVIDRAGIVRWRHVGGITAGDTTLAAAVRRALDS